MVQGSRREEGRNKRGNVSFPIKILCARINGVTERDE